MGEECRPKDVTRLAAAGRPFGVPAPGPAAAYIMAVLPDGVLMRTGTPIGTGEAADDVLMGIGRMVPTM
jgi:hypothetical protein